MQRPLADFLEQLDEAGQLARISLEVDPVLEISEITTRTARAGGPALLFENVRGHQLPVVTNLLASRERIGLALGIERFDELADRVRLAIWPPEESWVDRLKLASHSPSLSNLRPRVVKTGACQQVVRLGRDIDLGELPLLHAWPRDAGPTIASGRLFCRSPETGRCHAGDYFLQALDATRLAVHWHRLQAGPSTLADYAARGQRMPIAVVLGGDPLYAFLPGAALPDQVDSFLWGGILRGRPLELVKCRTHELEVPADAEIVLEGYVDPAEALVTVGPFGGPDGFESHPQAGPVLHLTAITHRSNPLYVASVPGRPPHEHAWIRHAVERASLPIVQSMIPELVDYALPLFTGPNSLAFVSIRKRYPQHARKVAAALWGLDYLMLSRTIILVDEHVDVHDAQRVLFEVGAHVDPSQDLLLHAGPTDNWDHSAAIPLQGQHLAIDATAKWPEESARPAAELEMSPNVRDLVSGRWTSYGFPPLEGD